MIEGRAERLLGWGAKSEFRGERLWFFGAASETVSRKNFWIHAKAKVGAPINTPDQFKEVRLLARFER